MIKYLMNGSAVFMSFIKKVKGNISIFWILLLTSPLLDLGISFLQNNFSKLSIIGTGIRGLILVSILFYTFFIKKEKNIKIMNYLIALLIYMLFFILYKGMNFSEITSIIKFFFFPLMLGCFLMHKEDLSKVKNSTFISGTIYMIFLVVPLLLGTAYNSYQNLKSGYVGWFSSANEISAIVALISPFMFLKPIEEKENRKKILYFIISLIYIYGIFSIGTKVPMLATIISLLLFLLSFVTKIFINKKERKNNIHNSIITIILMIASVIIFYTGVGYNNILLQNNKYETNNNQQTEVKPNIPDIETNNNETSVPEIEIENPQHDTNDKKNEVEQDTKPSVKNYFTDYKSSKIINMIFSSRDIYFIRKLSVWINSDLFTKLFGMGNIYIYNNEVTQKLVEIDFIDIFFNFGLIGFALYFSLIFIILFNLIIYVIKNTQKTINNNEICTYIITIFLAIIISIFAGHILGAPAVSILVAITLSTYYNEIQRINLTIENYFNKKRAISLIVITFLMCIFGIILNTI